MKKKECPSCAMNIDAKSSVCPICGYEFPKSSGGLRIAAILLLIIVLLWMLGGLFR